MTGWHKSSHCSADADCVWVDIRADVVRVGGHSKAPTSSGLLSVLTFTHDEWAAFVAGVKAGEFDLPEVTP
jgi:hypothetical protein